MMIKLPTSGDYVWHSAVLVTPAVMVERRANVWGHIDNSAEKKRLVS
uniref:Uncharacterized protein n=1 Tax=Anguilla anguilla TaxID=7936 RepID=A0A0E9VEU0_ANGAN